MPHPATWTIRSSVETALRLGRDNFTAFFTVALIFAIPPLVMETRGIVGIPKIAADIVCNVATYVCILCGALHALDDHALDVQGTLRQIHRPTLLGLLALGVVQSLAIVGGGLLIVPGLYLMTIWAVAVPVMLVEGSDMREAFQRSTELTDGRRWRILGASAVCVVAVIAIFTVLSFMLRAIPLVDERIELQALLHWLVGAACIAFVHPLSAVLYILLRQEKERLSVAQIVGTLD